MRRTVIVLAALVVLAIANWTIASREALVTNGRVVLLELAPVDPRSLMQGDYMALRFRIATEAFGQPSLQPAVDGRLVAQVDAEGAGTFRRFDDGTPLAADEVLLRYR